MLLTSSKEENFLFIFLIATWNVQITTVTGPERERFQKFYITNIKLWTCFDSENR